MKTVRKPLIVIGAALLVLSLTVIAGTLVWLKSDHGRQWVLARIDVLIPGSITIEAHRLSLLPVELELADVILKDRQDKPLAGVARLYLRLEIGSLMKREIRLARVLIDKPWSDLVVAQDGSLNLTAALMDPKPPDVVQTPPAEGIDPPFNLAVTAISLSDGRLTFKPSDGQTYLEADGINLSADGNLLERSIGLDLSVAGLLFQGAGIHPGPARIALKASLDGGQLSLSALNATSGQSRLTLSGRAADLFSEPKMEMVLFLDSRLEELKSVFDLPGDYQGSLKADLTVRDGPANPDAGLVLAVGSGRIAGQPMDRADLAIDLHDRQVTIDTAALRLADGMLSLDGMLDLRAAFPTGFLAPPTDVNAIAYTLNLVQIIPAINPWIRRFVDIQGQMTSRLSLSGSGVMPADITATLMLDGSGQNLLAPGMDRPLDLDLGLSAQLEHNRISISRLDAAAEDLRLSGQGQFQIADRTLAGDLFLTAEDLSRTLAVVGLPLVRGACNAELSIGGSLNQPQLTVDLTSTNLGIDRYTIGDLTIEAGLDPDGRLQLTDLTLHNRESRIQANGHTRLLPGGQGIDPDADNALVLTLEKVSAADFMEFPPIVGTLDGRLQLGGRLASLKGKASLTGASLGTDAATIGDVETRLRLNDGTVFVDRFDLTNQQSTLNAAGNARLLSPESLRLVENPSFDVSAHSGHLDPGDFIEALSGQFTIDANISGSVDQPVGKLTVAGQRVDIAGQSVEALSLDARLDNRRLWLDRLTAAVAEGEQIEAGGWLDLDKTFDLNIKSDGVSASHIHHLSDLLPGDGRLQVDVTAKGKLENPDVDGHLTVTDILVDDQSLQDIDLNFSLHDMRVKATGNLNFEMDAACDLRKGDFDARLTFDQTETESYFKAAGKPGFHGTLSGRVEAAGNIRDVANASANVDLKALELKFEETALVRSDRIVAQLADQELIISEFEMALLSSGSLRLEGDARLSGSINMQVDGQVPLAAAAVFSDSLVGAKGTFSMAGRISGQTTDPQINARIDLQQIAMTVPGLTQKLRDLNGSIHLAPDHIRIEALKGFLDTGSFTVDGNMDHEKFTPTRVNLSIDAQALPLEIPETLAVLINGDIDITGNQGTAGAKGEITLLEGIYYKDVQINLLQMATTQQRPVTPASRPVSIPYFETVNLDIKIGHRQPFMVQNNMAELEISPDLKIGGSLANPIISGRAQVREGTVAFQKKTFTVNKGIIDFVNPYKTEAELDIESETQIRSWTIKLAIKGTPDNLELLLTSVPTETDSDILSLILFGRTAQELTAGEGGTQQTTGQIMAEMLASTFGDDIKKTTGVDILQLETNGSDDDQDAAGVKVTVGKHLSDRMTVKYAVETKDGEITQRAITEYKLFEHILVSGFQDNKGVYGSELTLRIEFR